MYTPEMLASMKKVEANREANIAYEPRRLTAEEKEALLREYHPDYRPEGFTTIKVGPNKGEKAPLELNALLEAVLGEEVPNERDALLALARSVTSP